MQQGMHSHGYRGMTTYSYGHKHDYFGATSLDPDTPGHIHYMWGKTSYNDGHIHYYAVPTGPSVKVKDGHTHHYCGATTLNDGHVHYYGGVTSIYSP